MSECRRRKSRRLLTILTRLLVGAVATLGLCVTLQSRVQTAAICAGELLCCARSATFLSCGGGGVRIAQFVALSMVPYAYTDQQGERYK